MLNLYEMDPKIYEDYISTKIEKRNFDSVFEIIKKIYKNKEHFEILDLCCGTGIFPRIWLSKLKKIKYLGVDINKDFIEFAKEKLKDNRFDFLVGNAVSFNAHKKFDIIVATSSYHHIMDKQKRKYLRNISNHLKKGGFLLVYEKMVAPFSNKIEEVDSGTKFYLERIKYMLKKEKLSEPQLFALFNEQYLTSIRKDEYKVDLEFFKSDINHCGLKINKIIKLWPKENLFNDNKVGDFVFLISRK